MDKHKADDTFGDQLYQDIGRPSKSLVVKSMAKKPSYSWVLIFSISLICFTPTFTELQVITAWAVTIVFGVFKFLHWSALLSSWKGIAISVVILGVITALMQVLIQFSQSERSNPAKVAPAKSRNTGESSLPDVKQDKQH